MAELKQISVTFEFDPSTETVSKLKCFVDGVEKRKTTTTRSKKQPTEIETDAIITLESNKLVFNNKAILDIGLEYQDRVVLKYEKNKDFPIPFPIIGTDISFDQEGSGNKVTKTNSVSYRGKANEVLAEYGSKFGIEQYAEGIWKLISLDGTKPLIYESIVDKAEEIEEESVKILTEDDEDIEINEMTFKL